MEAIVPNDPNFSFVSFQAVNDFERYKYWNMQQLEEYVATLPPRPRNPCLYLFPSHMCVLCSFPIGNKKRIVGDYSVCHSCHARCRTNSASILGPRSQSGSNHDIIVVHAVVSKSNFLKTNMYQSCSGSWKVSLLRLGLRASTL
jgi:hypothetical protein